MLVYMEGNVFAATSIAFVPISVSAPSGISALVLLVLRTMGSESAWVEQWSTGFSYHHASKQSEN